MKRKLIRTEEWQAIPIGFGERALSREEVSQIFDAWRSSTGSDPDKFFTLKPDSLVPKNWSGIVPAGNIQLEVMPPGSLHLSVEQTRQLDLNISLMTQSALVGRQITFEDGDVSEAGDRFLGLISTFAKQLKAARARHVSRQYRTYSAVTRVVRGKIAFPQQILESIRNPGAFASRWVALDQDTPENRYFRAVIQHARPHAYGELRARLDAIDTSFEDVPVAQEPRREWSRIRFDRLPEDHVSALRIGRAIIDGEALGLFSGLRQGGTEIVFTAKAYEYFLANHFQAISSKFGFACAVQSRGHLGSWSGGGRDGLPVIELIPDIQLYPLKAGHLAGSIVVDTKWKRLKPEKDGLGVDPADVYQMLTYAARFGHKSAILLYPWMSDHPLEVQSLRINSEQLPVEVHVATVPMLERNLCSSIEPLMAEVLGKNRIASV